MLALIGTLFPTVASWINLIIGYFQAREAAQTSQDGAVTSAIADHNQDGASSVADGSSTDAQIAALKQEEQTIDGPSQVVVVPPPLKGN